MGLFRLAKDQSDFADFLNEFGLAHAEEFFHQSGPGFAIANGDFNLDQLMVFKCALEFGEYTLAEAIASDGHYGVKVVPESSELFLFGAGHAHAVLPLSWYVYKGYNCTLSAFTKRALKWHNKW